MQAAIQTTSHNDEEYESFLKGIRSNFSWNADTYGHLFTTNAEGLFDAFLAGLPDGEIRQHYTCHACRRFVNTFGGLVTITEFEGEKKSVMWDSNITPILYRDSVANIEEIIKKSKVTGAFYSEMEEWGTPVTDDWHHMAVTPSRDRIFKQLTKTASQEIAEKKEDFKTLLRGLLEFPIEAVNQAINLLKTDSLYRSEKTLGVAEWLKSVHESRASTKNKAHQTNLIWRAVAWAPPGFCHVKSTMIGTLLEDIVAGMPFETIKRRFDDKMHPLRYQRPQEAPKAGNIAQAEKIISQLKAAGSLKRRYAKIDEIQSIWKPVQKDQNHHEQGDSSGVFSKVKARDAAKEVKEIDIPAQTMTWDKFNRTVLPTAVEIMFYVPTGAQSYIALVTASNMEAPPILQWDLEDSRNPVSWYLYVGGSLPSNWNIHYGESRRVTAVCFQPSMWYGEDKFQHQGKGVMFLLEGARDLKAKDANVGNALFPEILKSELHGIRATIEAYSKESPLSGFEEATACGIMIQAGGMRSADLTFMVTSNDGSKIKYRIDRWD